MAREWIIFAICLGLGRPYCPHRRVTCSDMWPMEQGLVIRPDFGGFASLSWCKSFAPCGGFSWKGMPTSLRPAKTNLPAAHNVTRAHRRTLHLPPLSRIRAMQGRSNKPTPQDGRLEPCTHDLPPQPSPPAKRISMTFNASLLYCGRCRQATPTRQRLLLVLPTGNLYEYLCAQCGTSTGSKLKMPRPESGLLSP